MSGLSTHVLDTARGLPAAGVSIQLWRLDGEDRKLLGTHTTDDDGRAVILSGDALRVGRYELIFAVGTYFRTFGASPEPAFLEAVVVRFGVPDAGAHLHVPLLVSPYSYSTYRGS